MACPIPQGGHNNEHKIHHVSLIKSTQYSGVNAQRLTTFVRYNESWIRRKNLRVQISMYFSTKSTRCVNIYYTENRVTFQFRNRTSLVAVNYWSSESSFSSRNSSSFSTTRCLSRRLRICDNTKTNIIHFYANYVDSNCYRLPDGWKRYTKLM